MSLKIHAFPPSPRSFKVLWAANQLGVEYEFKLVDFSKQGQKAPEFLALNPNGKAPVLEHDGYALWESNAIVEYLEYARQENHERPPPTGRTGAESTPKRCKALTTNTPHVKGK